MSWKRNLTFQKKIKKVQPIFTNDACKSVFGMKPVGQKMKIRFMFM